MHATPGFLLLEDGTLFRGHLDTAAGIPAAAEVVFTTNMSGYQEVFTDPSFRGQIVVMTSPMIGNYGTNGEDPESTRPQVSGVIVRELSGGFSNWRADGGLSGYLLDAQIPILKDVDTRRLTRHLRTVGVLRGVIAAGTEPTEESKRVLDACPAMTGLDLASLVSTTEPYTWGDQNATHHIVAFDYGIKQNILRLFADRGCRVTIVPSNTPAAAVIALNPDGVFLANGPGDPDAVSYAPATIRTLAERRIPIFGICLGHQLLALTFGARTFKLPYGHRGGNHPVKDLATGHVLITAQNHGFAVEGSEAGIPGAPDLQVTHVNLNDGSVEGLRHKSLPIFAVQYHPEAAPGPHDGRALFDDFLAAVQKAS
ncbi:MAG: glutamine-hydrolyzing carbamoyl-phosphate synthase small subunit [Gemmatimonadetes bacterium]|nr:glutamine-hydrolyzing carbamoyl-phosphate synthase small subunit [Gemmatimonadota bacterium]MBI3566798.1 glutamine-hydrolyzing carbamoyl-phosphate synthase small subunit [Gemmatimonadota bacterium]